MSEIRATTISDTAGTGPVTLTKQSAAKAFVNFDGTGTIAARDSMNVASLTDNGSGDYTINFSNSFSGATYSNALTARGIAATIGGCGTENHDASRNTGSLRVYSLRIDNGGVLDTSSFNAQIHGDLA